MHHNEMLMIPWHKSTAIKISNFHRHPPPQLASSKLTTLCEKPPKSNSPKHASSSARTTPQINKKKQTKRSKASDKWERIWTGDLTRKWNYGKRSYQSSAILENNSNKRLSRNAILIEESFGKNSESVGFCDDLWTKRFLFIKIQFL